ncbi:hypothetical protein [Halomonas sp. KO116]|uniref:hypothetical protein n=1 Tax=Halomonas sp. KO116 TaxID=1504981 RepID=UPI0004E3B16F|nr:hypothetical protein [Halomonas sp. KO116]AJY53281.1 hypothetical protein KO116_P200174 [Halomonas sp. KO116]
MANGTPDLPRFTIRQFSRRVGCNSLSELKASLSEAFAGESVSIQYTRATGLSATLFVDVTQQGIFESYGEQRAIDWGLLEDGHA